MNVALGDHQVTNWQADVEARTIGAQIHTPDRLRRPLAGRRRRSGDIQPDRRVSVHRLGDRLLGQRPDAPEPRRRRPTRSAPIRRRSANIPNRSGEDPHGLPRVDPQELQMVSDFLRPDAQSSITDTCGGLPCFADIFNGP